MDYDIDVRHLSKAFYAAYPRQKFKEILHKPGRPYSCLLIETKDDYFVCIPFRSDIDHKNAYFFKNSSRSQKSKSGLDYKKLVLIKDNAYISGNQNVVVDQDEYTEVMKNISQIVNEVSGYISIYINHINGSKPLHKRQYDRKYRYSTLPYFHDVLGLV